MKGFRTIIANIALGLIPLIEVIGQLANLPELQAIIPSEYLPYYMLGVVVLNMILRHITTTPVGYKQ